MEEHSVEVHVYIYDLSKGLARSLSQTLLGKQIDGIWHTGIVVFGEEFFFGGLGIESCDPGHMVIGRPDKIVTLGKTQVPYDIFMDYLRELSQSSFRGDKYHLLDHNCNTFSQELATFLTGQSIPSYITELPQEVLNTPFGAMLRPAIDAMSTTTSGHALFQRDQSETPAVNSSTGSAAKAKQNSTVEAPPLMMYDELKEQLSLYETCRPHLGDVLSQNDVELTKEVVEYLTTPDCTWSVSRPHIELLARSMLDNNLPSEIRHLMGGLLQCSLQHTDVTNLCTVVAGDGALISIARRHSELPTSLLATAAKCLCNCLATDQGQKWLSTPDCVREDSFADTCVGSVLKHCVACLLCMEKEISAVGIRLSSGLARSRVMTSEVAEELSFALLEVYNKQPELEDDHFWFSLARCIQVSDQVADVAKTMGVTLESLQEDHPSFQRYLDHCA